MREHGDDEYVGYCLDKIAFARAFAGDVAGALAHVEEELDIRRRTGTPHLFGSALITKAAICRMRGDFDAAAADRACRRGHGICDRRQCMAAISPHRPAKRRTGLDEVRRASDPAGVGKARRAGACRHPLHLWSLGGRRALQAAREAVQSFRTLDAPHELYLALTGLAWAGMVSAEPDSDDDREACAALQEVASLERLDLPPRYRCWSLVARSRRLRTDYDAQVKLLNEMHELAVSVGATERALTAEVNLLSPLLELGRIDEMIVRSRNLMSSNQHRGERLGGVLLDLAEALVRRGETIESREFAREGLRVLTQRNSAHAAFAVLFEIATIERRYQDAARLAGYAEVLLAASGAEHPAAAARAIADSLSEIDKNIGRAKRDQLMREGAKLTEAQAQATALSTLSNATD